MAVYYDLFIRCPACIARGESGGAASQWYHIDCGGKLRVGDTATYQCTRCSEEQHVKYWRYACREHESDFRPTTAAHLADAVSTAGQITGKGGRQWLMRFLDAMGDF